MQRVDEKQDGRHAHWVRIVTGSLECILLVMVSVMVVAAVGGFDGLLGAATNTCWTLAPTTSKELCTT